MTLANVSGGCATRGALAETRTRVRCYQHAEHNRFLAGGVACGRHATGSRVLRCGGSLATKQMRARRLALLEATPHSERRRLIPGRGKPWAKNDTASR
jgi:hypothetical protein